jgi:4-hydroxy-tetrahydrodipicolinate synthase
VAIKLEDAPTPPKISRLLAQVPDLTVYGGLGGVSAYAELERGAAGTMTGFAYPEILRAVRLALAAGDRARAARVFDAFLPLIAFEGQPGSGLGIRKELLRRRGALASAATRGPVPATAIDPVTSAELDDVLERVGLVPDAAPLDVDAALDARRVAA